MSRRFTVALGEPEIDPSEYPDDREAVLSEELDEYIKLRKEHKDWLSTPVVSNRSIAPVERGIPKDEASDEYITAEPAFERKPLDLELNLVDSEAAKSVPVGQVAPQPLEVDDNPMASFIASTESGSNVDLQAVRSVYSVMPSLKNIYESKKAILGTDPASESQAAALSRQKDDRVKKTSIRT